MNLVISQTKSIPVDSISIDNFSLKAGSKVLFEDSSLTLSKGLKYGLIGKNGCGKTSLIKQIANRKFNIHPNILILHVEQEIEQTDVNPIEIILKSNRRMTEISKKIKEIELLLESNDNLDDEIFEEYEQLQQEIKSFEPEKQKPMIKKILKGLGFTDKNMQSSCSNFSGGWKMRISLAKALYIEPDLLLLDEPTNHLDLEAVLWLSDYLENLKSMALIISHNVGFLNRVCSNILNIENFKLVNYRGNYAAFKNNFYKKQKTIIKDWNKYEKKLKKFKNKSKSKKDIDEFIKKNIVPKPEKDYNLKIRIPETAIYNGNIIQLNNVSFSYDNNKIFDNIDFGLDMESVVTLVGKNGSGKSTLLKLIMGELQPSSGNIWRQNGMRIGYYNQHFENTLPLNQSPVEYLESIFPEKLQSVNKINTIRGYLGQMRLEGKAHVQKIGELSGGQKARVAMIKLIFTLPHLILLDEPTNHLDLETIEALIKGLKNYNGGIMVITHEEELITQLDSQLWVLENKKINFYRNTFEDYCDEIIN
jgi:ATP-binding cassette subfamily F protein 1